MNDQPFIVGIGGTVRPGSSTECALGIALAAAEKRGARTCLFGGTSLVRLPHYGAPDADQDIASQLVAALRRADGVILASPGYHGTISGLVKNAIDFIEETARDPRVYLDGVPVGLISTAYGWQAAGSTLAGLRSTVHALRGWPTPFGAAINCSNGVFVAEGCTRPDVIRQLETVGQQVWEFVQARASARESLVPEVLARS